MKQENINEVFNLWFNNKLDGVHTILPGQIVNYEGHSTRKAEVKVMVKLRNCHNQIIEIAPIKNVPVIFPSTKNFNLLFPLQKNDGCLLVFSESSIGNFLLNATNNALEADDLNRFDMSDCICIPGLWSFPNVPNKDTGILIEITDTDKIIMKSNLGKIEIANSGSITFDDGTESFVKGNVLDTWFTAFMIALNSHTHSGVTVGGGSTGSPNAAFTAPSNWLSTDIKGK